MKTSEAEAHGWRCPRCGDDTAQDPAGRGFVRHQSNKACGYGHGERERLNPSSVSWAVELSRIADAAEADRLRSYWSAYRGRMFDVLAAQGPFDRFTGSDLYACALLSAPIDPKAGVLLLDDEADECSQLLRSIPTDVSIRNARAAAVLADGSPASRLYQRLRGVETVGPTRASKLLAAKRPGLVPIRDSFLEEALGAASETRWWAPMLEAWADPSLGAAVDRLRARAGDAVPHFVTDLRLLDVATWLSIEVPAE